jgi:hypothetical protein
MLRLDPAHPPLWRSATCLQFGIDDVARLDEPEPWEELLIAELVRGLERSAVEGFLRAHDVPPAAADAFFAELQPVLREDPPPSRVVLQTSDEFSASDLLAIRSAVERAGALVEVHPWAGRLLPVPDREATVIVVAAYRVDPRRAAALVREDLRHVPLVFDGAGATVGPVIEPGRTACLACGEAYARDRDPAFPLVAAQLLGRRAPRVGADLAAEAARTAAQLVSRIDARTVRSSVRLRVDSPRRQWKEHPPHAECGCRSLGGTGRAPAPPVPILAPSLATAIARPA